MIDVVAQSGALALGSVAKIIGAILTVGGGIIVAIIKTGPDQQQAIAEMRKAVDEKERSIREDLQEGREWYKKQCDQLRGEIDDLRESHTKLAGKHESLKEEHEELEEEYDSLRSDHQDLRRFYCRLRKKYRALYQDVVDMTDSEESIDHPHPDEVTPDSDDDGSYVDQIMERETDTPIPDPSNGDVA